MHYGSKKLKSERDTESNITIFFYKNMIIYIILNNILNILVKKNGQNIE